MREFFSGRLDRSHFVFSLLFLMQLLYLIFSLSRYINSPISYLLALPLVLAIVFFILIIMVKRLHDLNYRGWLAAVLLFANIPVKILGSADLTFLYGLLYPLFLLYLIFAKGTQGENRYGTDPAQDI